MVLMVWVPLSMQDLDEEEYEETKQETLEQLKEFEASLVRSENRDNQSVITA